MFKCLQRISDHVSNLAMAVAVGYGVYLMLRIFGVL
jgi:hypothetical protein